MCTEHAEFLGEFWSPVTQPGQVAAAGSQRVSYEDASRLF